MKDGFYWIDPNLGMPDDAVKVNNNIAKKNVRLYFTSHSGVVQHGVRWGDLRFPGRAREQDAKHPLEEEH